MWAGRSETHLTQRMRPGQKREVRECTHGELGTGGQLGRKEVAGLEYRIRAGKQRGKKRVAPLPFATFSLSHKHLVSFLRYHVIHNINKFIVIV